MNKEITNIAFDGIDHNDSPDFCDAYIVSAERNGVPLSESEIDELNEDRDFVHERLTEHLY